MILDIQQRLSGAVRQAARAAFDVDLAAVSFQYPPRVELGDLALTAPFDLARSLRRKPREIAERLAAELASAPGVTRAEVALEAGLVAQAVSPTFSVVSGGLACVVGAGLVAFGYPELRGYRAKARADGTIPATLGVGSSVGGGR